MKRVSQATPSPTMSLNRIWTHKGLNRMRIGSSSRPCKRAVTICSKRAPSTTVVGTSMGLNKSTHWLSPPLLSLRPHFIWLCHPHRFCDPGSSRGFWSISAYLFVNGVGRALEFFFGRRRRGCCVCDLWDGRYLREQFVLQVWSD